MEPAFQSTKAKNISGASIAANISRSGRSMPAMPVLTSTGRAPVQRASGSGGKGIKMEITPNNVPNPAVIEYNYDDPVDPVKQGDATDMYFDIWGKLNALVDVIISNPISQPTFTPFYKDLISVRAKIKTGDLSKSHAPIVDWYYNKGILKLPEGQTDPDKKKLKKDIDSLLVLSNLLVDMSGANDQQLAGKKSGVRLFYIKMPGSKAPDLASMVTVDMNGAIPYISNLWAQPNYGKSVIEALPSKTGAATFQLHALNNDIAKLYETAFKGKRIP